LRHIEIPNDTCGSSRPKRPHQLEAAFSQALSTLLQVAGLLHQVLSIVAQRLSLPPYVLSGFAAATANGVANFFSITGCQQQDDSGADS
jgi:hypothetical protein